MWNAKKSISFVPFDVSDFFVPFDDASYTGRNIADLVSSQTTSFELMQNFLFFLLTMHPITNIVVDHIKNPLTLSCHSANDFFCVWCICHIYNLIVQSAFNDIRKMIQKLDMLD